MMLRIAVQTKGRLFEETMTMLAESSIKIEQTKRTLLVPAKNFPVEILYLRDDDIPQAVASGIGGRTWEETLEDVKRIHPIAMKLGEPTWAASILSRLEVFERLMLSRRDELDDEAASRFIYDVIGTGTMTSESVTAALCVAFWCRDAWRAAELCANMGGDTDTIGSMAAAICAAHNGIDSIPTDALETLERVNSLNFRAMADEIVAFRPRFTL